MMLSEPIRFGTMTALLATIAAGQAPTTGPAARRVPENVYRGELVSFPGPWAYTIGRAHIILVSDEQLEALADPDQPVNISLTNKPHEQSLRQICEHAQAAGQRTLVIAFDHFFAQYRPGQAGKPRRLTPDKDEYIQRIAVISRFAQQYGLGLELSLLSPLEIGPACAEQTGESGVWMHYRKGVRDPVSGHYSVQLWRQRRWANNKGPIEIADAGVRVFAFRERRLHGSPYLLVNPADIVEISQTAEVEVWPDSLQRHGDYEAVRVRIHGSGGSEQAVGRDRVLVVQIYRTPEMDYLSDKALPYLNDLTDRYVDAGVRLNALYSDEMHIQQDWGYHHHHDHGEFALRYVSPGLAKRFAAQYGDEYRDFARHLIYFVRGQEDTVNDLDAKAGLMHVPGESPGAVRSAALLRSRYYRLLQDGVVDLFIAARRHLEQRIGYRLDSRAHATWAESPTCDRWAGGNHYEYTSDFVWSNTVQQAASACHDYFKWGEFLTGTGNDHTEGGWLDRNYLALALACSTGIINEVPYSYAAHWGMPHEIAQRRQALVNASGAFAQAAYGMVQGMVHRDVDVLMLYPLDLVAVDERFGSWMTQYGYANLITQAKLLELGRVEGGAVELAGRRFTTLVATFEPFPSAGLLEMMRQLAGTGGRVIWSGPPPVLLADGTSALSAWENLAGVRYTPALDEGLMAPGKRVVFESSLAHLPPMTILTDLLVDRIYPVQPGEGVEAVARVRDHVVGTHRLLDGGGSVTFLGFRPRDDQSASLGYESRWWFDTLSSLGAYAPTGRFPDVNDNTEHLSRTTDYLACRFPNGAVGIAPHLHRVQECWPGGFARDAEQDRAIMEKLKLPPPTLALQDFRVNGHTVSYQGERTMSFRVNDAGELLGFCGAVCSRITVNGRTIVFADQPMGLIAWAPVEATQRVPGGAVARMCIHGSGTVRIPTAGLPEQVHIVTAGSTPGSRGNDVPAKVEDGALVFTVEPGKSNGWLYVVPGAG